MQGGRGQPIPSDMPVPRVEEAWLVRSQLNVAVPNLLDCFLRTKPGSHRGVAAHHLFNDFAVQTFHVSKVMIERRRRDPGLVANGAHGGSLSAAYAKKAQSGIEDTLTRWKGRGWHTTTTGRLFH